MNDIMLRAYTDERTRQHEGQRRGRQAEQLKRMELSTSTRPAVDAVGQQLRRILTELYGSDQGAGADPALFRRLAWLGIEE